MCRKQSWAAGKARNAAFVKKVSEFVADHARPRPGGDKRRTCHEGTQISSIEKSKAIVMP